MKKFLAIALCLLLAGSVLAACSNNNDNSTTSPSSNPSNSFDTSKAISVVTREEGSGTRSGFIELFGIEVKNDDGTKKDMTTKEAITADKTDIMMTNIGSDPYAIGYCSMGSLNSAVKALDIDGVNATAANVENGSYKIQRPFNIAYKGELTGLAKDFVDFILSKEGQDVVTARGCIAIDKNAPAYSGDKPSGKIVVEGSSSVHPVMEKLREAYLAINPNAEIEVQMTDSSAGMTSTINGTCDIGMASRDLKDSEKAALNGVTIAIDGLAVIVNNSNTTTKLTTEQVRSIFTGETTKWSDIK